MNNCSQINPETNEFADKLPNYTLRLIMPVLVAVTIFIRKQEKTVQHGTDTGGWARHTYGL